jgi:hypothetical protein
MVGVRKVAFHLLVLFFAGSVVAVAAYDMRSKLEQQGDAERAQVEQLIKQLKGDALTNKSDNEGESEEGQSSTFLQPSVLPPRAPGRLLTERDRQIFRSVLRRFIAVSEEAAS